MKFVIVIVCAVFFLGTEIESSAAVATNRTSSGARASTSTITPTATETQTTRPDALVPSAPVRTVAVNVSDNIRQLLLDAETLRQKFLEQRAEALKKLREASEADRDQIRRRIREAQASFFDAQTQLREKIQEVRSRTGELRQELKDHSAVVDAAKEQTRDRIRERRAGTD